MKKTPDQLAEELAPSALKSVGKIFLLTLFKMIALWIIFCGGFGMVVTSWEILIVGYLLLSFINVMISKNMGELKGLKDSVEEIKKDKPSE